MTLVPWKGKGEEGVSDETQQITPLDYFRGEMDRLFDRFFGATSSLLPEGFGAWGGWAPSMDVTETESEVLVRLEVAGVDPKDIEISIAGQVLSISGEKKETTETKNENFHRSERRFGSFKRSVQLPTPVETDSVSAEHKQGVLTVRMKKERSVTPKRIPVRAAKD